MRMLEKQGYHLLSLIILLSGVYFTARGDFLEGAYWGLTTRTWLLLSVLIPVLHQVYVVIIWRAELHYQIWSSWFGSRAFFIYGLGFMILFLARPVSIFGLAIANRGTVPLPGWLGILLAILCLPPVFYLGYSVIKSNVSLWISSDVGSRVVVFVQGGLVLSIIQSFVYLGPLLFHRISGHEVYLSILIIPLLLGTCIVWERFRELLCFANRHSSSNRSY